MIYGVIDLENKIEKIYLKFIFITIKKVYCEKILKQIASEKTFSHPLLNSVKIKNARCFEVKKIQGQREM